MLLDKQYYNPNDPRPYDDVGWTLGPLYNAITVRVEDPEILAARMTLMPESISVPGGAESSRRAPVAFVVNYNADNKLASFRFAHATLEIQAAERSFANGDMQFRVGSFIIPADGNPDNLGELLGEAGAQYGFTAYGASSMPDVPTHAVATPRVAVMHTWTTTQSEGWLRLGMDEYGIPYDYISVHDARDEARLIDRYDIILMGPSSADALSIVHGLSGDVAVPWKATALTPNLGYNDATDDMRGGLALEGVLHLQRFIEAGGTFITLANSASLPIHFGLARGIGIKQTPDLWARGGVYRAELKDAMSPLAYGYGEELGVYFNSSPVFERRAGGGRFRGFGGASAGDPGGPGSTTGRRTGRGGIDEDDIVQGRPRDLGRTGVEVFQEENPSEPPQRRGQAGAASFRTVFAFASDPEELLISGGIRNGQAMAGAPALVDVSLGEGHVVMFSFNPFWRSETLGSYALVFNALLHHGHLSVSEQREEVATEASGSMR
jgi:hypothetical protein